MTPHRREPVLTCSFPSSSLAYEGRINILLNSSIIERMEFSIKGVEEP
jgi:hypothetical protein